MLVIEGQESRVVVPRLQEAQPVRRERDSGPLLPTTVLGWIPFWWTRVLFPGRAEGKSRGDAWRLAAMIVLPALLLYPCLSFYLFEPDEGRYAQIPREMLERGEWLVPTLQGKPYLDKPPLFYWLVMLSYSVFGFHDWAARLVPALATHGTILLGYFFGRRFLGPRPAFWGGLFLTLAPGFIGVSRLLVLDGLLTFLVTLSWLAGYTALTGPRLRAGWWALAGLACGLGVLTKGPIAIILFVPPIWLARRLSLGLAAPSWHAVLGFAGLSLAVNLPWYIAILFQAPEFAGHFFWQHNVQRFVEPFDHQQPLWFFVPLLLLGMLPAMLVLPSLLRFLISSEEKDAGARPGGLGFLLLAGGWCFLFFSLSGCKLPTYILPAFAPLALALGCCFTARFSQPSRRRSALLGLAGIWFLLLIVCHWMVLPREAQARSPMGRPEEVRAWCDAETPVYCFPRPVDSVAFYLGRQDLVNYRSKDLDELLLRLQGHSSAVVLFSHRHSIDLLRKHLPPTLSMTEEAPLGVCKMAKITRTPPPIPAAVATPLHPPPE